MDVSLTLPLEELVMQKVNSGLYHSVSDVISEALRLLDERDHFQEMKLDALRKEIAVGVEQADKGETTPLDFEAIKAEGQRQLSQ
jgi:antitoxin ParD1/3/4